MLLIIFLVISQVFIYMRSISECVLPILTQLQLGKYEKWCNYENDVIIEIRNFNLFSILIDQYFCLNTSCGYVVYLSKTSVW